MEVVGGGTEVVVVKLQVLVELSVVVVGST